MPERVERLFLITKVRIQMLQCRHSGERAACVLRTKRSEAPPSGLLLRQSRMAVMSHLKRSLWLVISGFVYFRLFTFTEVY